MSLTMRRTVSWLGTLAVLAACAAGITHLPGWIGVPGEARWLLRHAEARPHNLDCVGTLLRPERWPNTEQRRQLVRGLLSDVDSRVVHGTLGVIATQMGVGAWARDGLPGGRADALEFVEWFRGAAAPAKLAQLPYTLMIADPPPEVAGPLLGDEDVAWRLVATLGRDPRWRPVAERLVFRHVFGEVSVCGRLALVDGLFVRKDTAPVTPLNWRATCGELLLDCEHVLHQLDNSNECVRWAAGRILTVAGDPRGLPAFREWLKAHPRIPPDAEKILTDLFNPEWRNSP